MTSSLDRSPTLDTDGNSFLNRPFEREIWENGEDDSFLRLSGLKTKRQERYFADKYFLSD